MFKMEVWCLIKALAGKSKYKAASSVTIIHKLSSCPTVSPGQFTHARTTPQMEDFLERPHLAELLESMVWQIHVTNLI
jgi:hypothetical protein